MVSFPYLEGSSAKTELSDHPNHLEISDNSYKLVVIDLAILSGLSLESMESRPIHGRPVTRKSMTPLRPLVTTHNITHGPHVFVIIKYGF